MVLELGVLEGKGIVVTRLLAIFALACFAIGCNEPVQFKEERACVVNVMIEREISATVCRRYTQKPVVKACLLGADAQVKRQVAFCEGRL